MSSGNYAFIDSQNLNLGVNKLMKIIVPTHKYSQLLQPFDKYIVKAGRTRGNIEYQKGQTRRSVETLGVSGDGDPSRIIPKSGLKSNPVATPEEGKR